MSEREQNASLNVSLLYTGLPTIHKGWDSNDDLDIEYSLHAMYVLMIWQKRNMFTAAGNHEFLKKDWLRFRTIVSEVSSIVGNPVSIKSKLYFSLPLLDFRFDVGVVLTNKKFWMNKRN